MNTSNANSENESSESFPHALVRASRSVRYAATAALILLAVFLFAETISAFQGVFDYSSPNTITVSGEGTATAIPDTATISFGATATESDVATAQADVTSIITTALASVKASGVSADDITTDSFNVSPHYQSPVCQPGLICSDNSTISGYDVSENVEVKITDTSKVSAILDGLAKANVTNVSGPEFVVGDTQKVQEQARAMAIQKAQQDAQVLAAQLHVRLGKIQSYSDTDGSSIVSPEPMMANSALAMPAVAPSPSVPVGQNTYTKDITITYEIY